MKIEVNATGNIEGLQILRAVAALMVVVHHARLSVRGSDGWPTFGEAGVDIFFVISGFVMAYTTAKLDDRVDLYRRLRATGDFLRKRVIRIVPLYWFALLWTSRRELAHGRYADLIKDMFFIPHPNATFHDWLAPTVQQGWTLNYEAFFYILFGLTMLWGRHRERVVIGALLAVVLAARVLVVVHWPTDLESAAGIARRFYGDDIVLEFGYGVLLERAMSRRAASNWPRTGYWLAAATGFLLLALLHGHGVRGILEGVPAALIVWAGIQACAGMRTPVFELLGAASFSIYLFHWASFGAVKPLAAALAGMPDGQIKVTLLMAVHFVVAVVTGIAIHIAIEKPLLRWARVRFGGRSRVVPAVLSA